MTAAARKTSTPETAGPAPAPSRSRLVGLDGLRGLAALYVVVYHIFLRAFPGERAAHAPFWAAGFRYGRFAVVVFIVLSGFSLSVGAARAGWRLDSVRTFAHRRAWRILPPYWAALVFSLLMTWFVLAQPGWAVPNLKSVAVNGLLIQDIVAAPSPNRSFWSIAIEAQLYVVFPLLIVAVRRVNAAAMLALVAAPVLTLGVLGAAHDRAATDLVNQYTPDLAVLFAIGVAAAGILTTTDSRRARPWHRYAVALAAPVFGLIAWKGASWTNGNLFWVDLALGPAIGCLLAAVATGQPKPLVGLLDTRPLRRLGAFSYSLYLTHAPIVIAVYYGLMQGRVPQGAPMFLVLCAVLLPLTVLFARLFAQVFELPFQRQRGWAAIRTRCGYRRCASSGRPAERLYRLRATVRIAVSAAASRLCRADGRCNASTVRRASRPASGTACTPGTSASAKPGTSATPSPAATRPCTTE